MGALDLSPIRGSLRRVAQRHRLSAVVFDERADFGDWYSLFGRAPVVVRAAFRPAVLDALVADPGWFIEARRDQWLFYRIKEQVAPERVMAFADQGLHLLDAILGAKAAHE